MVLPADFIASSLNLGILYSSALGILYLYHLYYQKSGLALADVAQWIKCWPVNQRAAGLIPSQGTCLGCGLGSQERECERLPDTDVSLPLLKKKSQVCQTQTSPHTY